MNEMIHQYHQVPQARNSAAPVLQADLDNLRHGLDACQTHAANHKQDDRQVAIHTGRGRNTLVQGQSKDACN